MSISKSVLDAVAENARERRRPIGIPDQIKHKNRARFRPDLRRKTVLAVLLTAVNQPWLTDRSG